MPVAAPLRAVMLLSSALYVALLLGARPTRAAAAASWGNSSAPWEGEQEALGPRCPRGTDTFSDGGQPAQEEILQGQRRNLLVTYTYTSQYSITYVGCFQEISSRAFINYVQWHSPSGCINYAAANGRMRVGFEFPGAASLDFHVVCCPAKDACGTCRASVS